MKISDVAKATNLTYDQVYDHVKVKKTLKAQKILGRYVIDPKDFEVWNRGREDNSQPGHPNTDIPLNHRLLGLWTVPVIELPDAVRTLCLSITGHRIVNSVESNPTRLTCWKRLVASRFKEERGSEQWDSRGRFAITVALRFCPKLHGGKRPLDVDNFIKPIIDTLAAGFFCDAATDPQSIQKFDYDDSNFNTLLIHRLANADRCENEGIAVYVSSRPK